MTNMMTQGAATPATPGLGYPFTTRTVFTPPGVPLSHPWREFHDDRVLPDGAAEGFVEVEVWDQEGPPMAIARGRFLRLNGEVVCDGLSVEKAYRGKGILPHLISTGSALCGAPVAGTDTLDDRSEQFWCSYPGLM